MSLSHWKPGTCPLPSVSIYDRQWAYSSSAIAGPGTVNRNVESYEQRSLLPHPDARHNPQPLPWLQPHQDQLPSAYNVFVSEIEYYFVLSHFLTLTTSSGLNLTQPMERDLPVLPILHPDPFPLHPGQ